MLTAAAEAETGSRGEVDATSLLAWREHGRDSEGIRSAEADGGSGLGVDGRDCWPASRLPAGGCWDLELHLGPRQLGPNRTSGWAATGRAGSLLWTGNGMQSASILVGLGGGRLDGREQREAEGVPVSNERSSAAAVAVAVAELMGCGQWTVEGSGHGLGTQPTEGKCRDFFFGARKRIDRQPVSRDTTQRPGGGVAAVCHTGALAVVRPVVGGVFSVVVMVAGWMDGWN